MAFDVASDATVEAPTHTTVASYKIERLGVAPVMTARFAETVDAGTNPFGIAAQRQAGSGRVWEITLDSANSGHFQLMAMILGGVSFKIIKAALAALSITDITDEQIMTAAGQIDNVDSVIASSLEEVEIARREGTDPFVFVMGDAPAAAPRV
jgi:hypothetical protein